LRAHPATAMLREAVVAQMRGTNVVKVKLYDLDGRTVFSTDTRQIGTDGSKNGGFLSARGGVPASELVHREKFSAFDQELEQRDMLSSYIGLRQAPNAAVEGVFEIYTDVTDL